MDDEKARAREDAIEEAARVCEAEARVAEIEGMLRTALTHVERAHACLDGAWSRLYGTYAPGLVDDARDALDKAAGALRAAARPPQGTEETR